MLQRSNFPADNISVVHVKRATKLFGKLDHIKALDHICVFLL